MFIPPQLAERVVVELTEREDVEDIQRLHRSVEACRALGIRREHDNGRDLTGDDLFVLEVSSFQLETIETFRPFDRRTLRLIGPGHTFNDVPALDGGPNPASVMAMEPTVALATSGVELRRLIADYEYQLKFVVARAEDIDELREIVGTLAAETSRVILMPEGRDPAAIAGLSWRNGSGAIVHNDERPVLEDMDSLPFVSEVYRRDLDYREYEIPWLQYPYVSFYRFHVMDPVYFSQDIKVTMQQLPFCPQFSAALQTSVQWLQTQ